MKRFALHILWVMVVACASPCAAPVAAQSNSPRWITSRVKGTPDPPPPYSLQQVLSDVEMDEPTEMIRLPGTDRWVVVERRGRIFTFSKNAVDRQIHTAMELRNAVPTMGQAYGVVFHRDYPSVPYCYIAFTAKPNDLKGTRLSRFHVTSTEPLAIDAGSETIFAEWNSEGHSGGSLHFGPDGYLYVSVGDGQNPNPPDKLDTGQDLSDLEASILRIDVDRTSGELPYAIPPDNPLVGQSGVREEIWAYGLRNPWKMAFDPETGTLWTADVGWEMMEMVYRIDRGANYGWSVMEGSQVVKENGARTSTPITPPIVEHTHLESRSITGGYFSYTDRLPDLRGAYLYGDWMTGKVWGLKHDGQKLTWQRELADSNLRVICFALDDDGEVLVVGYDGTVHRLVPNQKSSESASFPRRLSETGLFASTPDQVPAVGVLPYEINAHHWADHSESRQWIAVPPGPGLGVFPNSDWKTGQVAGHFIFPHDTVLVKTVSIRRDVNDPGSSMRLETQLLHRHGDDWNAYNYIWNDDQTDAVLQDNVGIDRELVISDPRSSDGYRKQTWHHASRDECSLCHIWSAGTIHGFKRDQLNRPDRWSDKNQLDRLIAQGIFEQTPEPMPPVVSPQDTSADLTARARSYLHLNCAHCHRRGGGGTAPFELVGDLPLEQLHVIDAPPSQGGFGIDNARVISPGRADRSVLMYRLVKSGRGRMPQFGPSLIDRQGVRLIRDWIDSMDETTSSGPSLREDIDADWVRSQLTSSHRALSLALACYDESVDESVRLAIADVASNHPESSMRELFEVFLPEDRRVKRLGTTIDPVRLLAMQGDPERGRQLYFESNDVTCRQCHRIGEQGSEVGPDLSSIALQRTPAEILDSILRPSEKIDEKYRGKLVLTVDGQLISGLVTSDTDESMTIVEPSGKARQIDEADIESIKTMEKSVMPDLLLSAFTAEQAADLLAFLNQQRKPLPQE